MLHLKVVISENYNSETNEFVTDEFDLDMEHSLLSLSKWESEHEKPFATDDEKSPEEWLSYFKLMTITPTVPDNVYHCLSYENMVDIKNYIEAKRTATWFRDTRNTSMSKATITSELVYYWMFSYGIPKECETWHFNRLMTLIRVFSVKNQPEKKKSQAEIAAENRALNAKRKAQLKTNG